MLMPFKVRAVTDPGIKRKNAPNQDCVGIVLPGFFQHRPPLLILADGMGGHSGGRVASQLVVNTFKQEYRHYDLQNNALPFLEHAVVRAHKAIVATARQDPLLSDMGSTVVAAIFYKDHIDLTNVGDSRAYLLREGKRIRISKDQSIVAEKVRQGLLSEKEARYDPHLNQLTMSISAKRVAIEPFLYSLKLQRDDRFILCSDGLWGVLPEPLIQSVIENFPLRKACTKLIQLTNDAGGQDNISIIIAIPPQK